MDQLAALGAIPCNSTLEVAENVDVLISMVPKSEHSKAVYGEALPAMGPDKICIDMSTIDPSVSMQIAKEIKATGAQFADAPVVKSKPAAIAGELGILVGCDEELFPQIALMTTMTRPKSLRNCIANAITQPSKRSRTALSLS